MRNLLPVIIFILLPLPDSAQIIKPGKPAFIVTYDEKGKNVNESWHYSATVKFSLSNWNNWYYENGPVVLGREKIVDFDPGLFLKLDPGTVINFYPSEVDESGSGSNGSYTRTLGTDGMEIITETTSDGTRTIVIDDAAYRQEHNIPTNEVYNRNARFYQLGELAELERTATGAILRAYTAVGNNLSEWAVSQEAMEQVFPKVETFVLTDKDIMAWQQISRTNSNSGSYDDESISVTLSVKMKSERAEVTLEGCSEMGAGEEGKVTAKGTPAGGTYEFWVDPSDLMAVDASGATATLTGSRPGRGTLYVGYTSPDGTKAEASKPAAMVRIYDYNGGEAIQIPLYDIDGNKLPGKLTIAYGSMPDEAQELVDFVSGNPAVFTAVATADNIDLQGFKTGKATLEARDNCGNVTGPTVEVEVVNCSDETKAKLAEEMRIAEEARKQAYEEIGKILGSEDFAKAADRIAESTGNLAIKLGGAIIGSLSAGKATAGVTTAAKIYGVGSNLYDFVNSLAAGENLATASNLAQMIVELGGTDNQQAAASAIETIQAAHEFGKDLGQLIATDVKLKEAAKWAEHWNKYVEDVVRRQKICRDSQEQPQATDQPPKKQEPPKPDPDKPAPQPDKPKPGTKEPVTDDTPAKDPTGDDQPGDDPGDTDLPPVPPVSEPRQIGLPYNPAQDCGCNSSREIAGTADGISDLGSGFTNLGKCVEDFSTGPLTEYVNTLKGWKEVSDILDNAIKAGPEELKKAAGETGPRIKSLLENTKSFDETGRSFYDNFKACPESMASSVSFMKSAFVVNIDSVKTNY